MPYLRRRAQHQDRYSDPAEEMVAILMTQRLMESPQPPRVFVDFWTSAYQAIDD